MGVALVFDEEKTKIIARATLANHKTAASLKIYSLFAQKHGLHLIQLIWSHFFFQKYGKNGQFFSQCNPALMAVIKTRSAECGVRSAECGVRTRKMRTLKMRTPQLMIEKTNK